MKILLRRALRTVLILLFTASLLLAPWQMIGPRSYTSGREFAPLFLPPDSRGYQAHLMWPIVLIEWGLLIAAWLGTARLRTVSAAAAPVNSSAEPPSVPAFVLGPYDGHWSTLPHGTAVELEVDAGTGPRFVRSTLYRDDKGRITFQYGTLVLHSGNEIIKSIREVK